MLNKKDKIKLLVWGDSPNVSTGFGIVMKNILEVLYKTGKYDITVIGINYDGSYYDREKYPYKIYPAIGLLSPAPVYQDLYGRQKLLDFLATGEFDLLFTLQDTFIIESVGKQIKQTYYSLPNEKKFRWILYYPIDAPPQKRWIENSVLLSDYPVAYTKYGYEETLKVLDNKEKEFLRKKLNVIYHGVNLKDFKPLKNKKELKKQFFGEKNTDSFIFLNVNRNQQRKMMDKTLIFFKELKKELEKRKIKRKVYLYMHCQVIDQFNLIEVGKQLGLEAGRDWAFPNPKKFNVAYGFTIETLNKIYNACDCIVSTTLGEGWGLSMTEGMATKTICLFPNNTTIPEILGNNGERGIVYNSGNNPSLYVVQTNDNDRLRPLPDIKDMIEKAIWIIKNPDKVKNIVERAYNWIRKLSWDGELIGKKWIALFDIAYKHLLLERNIQNLNLKRNDLCPICNIKFKKCIHYESAIKTKMPSMR